MKLAAARAVEMTVAAKPCGFRPHLGNRCAISTFPPPRRLLDCFLNSNPERSFPQPSAQASFRLILRLEKTMSRAGCRSLVIRVQHTQHSPIQLRGSEFQSNSRVVVAWVVRAFRRCVRTVPSLKGLASFSDFTQGLTTPTRAKAACVGDPGCGAGFYAIRSTLATRPFACGPLLLWR